MKKIIIIMSGLGALGFGGMFALAWFTTPHAKADLSSEVLAAALAQASADTAESEVRQVLDAASPKLNITERQLRTLIQDVRDKISDYNEKFDDLESREKRLQIAKDTLRQDIQEMEQLRVELAAAISSLRDQQEKLLSTQVEIDKVEQENLVSIAAAYDKMDAQSAGIILMNMVKNQGSGNSADDAVKILYYMTERTKAKVLASVAEAEPAVSAYFCQKLKKMVTKE